MKQTIYIPITIPVNYSLPMLFRRLMKISFIIVFIWLNLSFAANAQLKVPAIPSNTQFSTQFEYDAEYIYRINLDGTYLEDGTLIAYIDGQMRGAQSASELFTPTGEFVYKVRVFSNTSTDDTITFRYYDVFNEKVYEIVETELFVADNVPDYYSPVTLNAECGAPGKATGLLPADQSSDQNENLYLYWQPSENTLRYNLFLWKDGDPEPTTPTISNISSTSVRVSNLTYGANYNWYIQSANQCLQDNSITQSFIVRELPDLTLTGISAVDSVFSATEFVVNFSVNNSGAGSTTSTMWYDAFYLSADNNFSGDDRLLGQVARKEALTSGSSYQQSIALSIPSGYTGSFYLIGVTDRSNSIPETDNSNNIGSPLAEIVVIEKPLPDVKVSDIIPSGISFEPGDSLSISWKVQNIGDAVANGGWTEKVSIVSLSGIRVNLTGTPQYTADLEKDGSVTRNYGFIIPKVINFSGEAYVEVEVIPSNALVEYPGNKANNKSASQNRITVKNKLYITIPASASEDYSGGLRSYIRRSGNYNNALTVNLSASPTGRVNIPSSVTIPEGSSSAVFDISMIDNQILEGPRQAEVIAAASGYDPASGIINILDNEKPTLRLSLNNNTASEGDSLQLTISRDLVTSDSAIVLLSTGSSSQWTFPPQLVIKGSGGSVQVKLKVSENSVPELNEEVFISARSEGMVSGSTSAMILDDDVPQIELEIRADSISEGAGPYATWGVLRRLGNSSGTIKVNLSADLANVLYFPASISLNDGVAEKEFNIGAIDNGLVDGYRTVKLTGQIYLSSCNCNTTAENGGIVSGSVTVADNDGPALTVSIYPASLREGVMGAGTMTVFRNTSTDNDLSLILSVNDTTEVSIPSTAVIPAGKTTVSIPIDTKDDKTDDGSQMVTFQAKAQGYSPGIAWADVTDINRPDLVMSDLELEKDTLITGRQIRVQTIIQNNGYGTAPYGTEISFYFSKDDRIDDKDSLVYTGSLTESIPIGESGNFLDLIRVPAITGSYKLLGKVNPEAKITELLYINNESTPVPVTIQPNYTATATVDEDYFTSPVPVTIHGEAALLNGNPAANVDLDVYLISGSVRKVFKVTSDENGLFSTVFEPFVNQAGHFVVGACYPGQGLRDEQDAFDILGMARTSRDYLVWNVKKDVPVSGTIGIKNRSEIPLTGITFEALSMPEGVDFTIDSIENLPGSGTAEFNFNISGSIVTEGQDYIEVPVKITSNEGISLEFNAYYYCQALGSHLVSNPKSINTTVTKNKSRYYDLRIINDGAGETGMVSIELPQQDWFSLASADTIENMVPGDTATLTLLFTPGEDIPLNTPIKGRIAVHNSNGDDLAIPYVVEVVSEETGGLIVDVVDEYTYYTDAAPHVQNAHVVVRHPFSGLIVAEGFTNANGIFEVDSLAEGSYKITVQAERHEGYQNVIVIDPGRINEETIFLSFQAITYTWEVVPTEIEDQYEVELVMEYETNVPVPVVIMEMPDVMPQLFNDETYTFLVTITNKGLITAKDVQLKFPEDDPEYEWITDFPMMDLLAQQAIQVPVTMRVKAGAQTKKSASATMSMLSRGTDTGPDVLKSGGGDCSDYAFTIYGWECGEDRQWHNTPKLFTISGRTCGSTGGINLPGGEFVIPVEEGGLGPATGGGEITIEYDPYEGTPSAEVPSIGCDPCLNSTLLTILGCVGGPLGTLAACGGGFVDGADLADGLGCIPGPPGCVIGVISTIWVCYNSPPLGLKKSSALPLLKAGNTIPPIIDQAVKELEYVIAFEQAERDYFSMYMGSLDWESKENFVDFAAEIAQYIDTNTPIPDNAVTGIKTKMAGTDITESEIDDFANHWNTTMEAWDKGILTRTAEYPDIIDQDSLESYRQKRKLTRDYGTSLGYSSMREMAEQAWQTLRQEVEDKRSSVCASVSIKISQKLVMTREAFEGTLTIFNGHETLPMEDINLNIEIRNADGELANDLFEIETKALDILTGVDGSGTLGANQTGSATLLFIPEKGAAPEVPESYSFGGSFSYTDPFTGVEVEKPLFPVTLQVNPSPDLFLHYFMQRDILGDDPLTEDKVEPIVPAELAVMIENNGYGTAKNVRIESAQPEIVDNEKGLAIHFELIGSNLNGEPMQLGLTNINFGNIGPLSTSIGQWWFTSDLLGHFVNYEANVTHLDSRGNPDLSLISGAELHELIRSIRVYGATDDGINDFLVNAYQDAQERPDAIYLSQGQQVLDVYAADAGLFEGTIRAPEFTNTLKVIASRIGWNYLSLPAPGNGKYEIVSVTRSDGQAIPLENAWLTHVTLPDGKEPVYENKFHIADKFEDIGEHVYTVVWKLKDPDPPAVVKIDGVPGSFTGTPVTNVNVKFNKAIDPATFTWEDLTLRLQGGDDIMDNTVVITKVDELNYNIDLSTLTTGNGFYALIVQAAEITDTDGITGTSGKQVSWTQFLNVPFVEEFIGLPEGSADAPFDYLLVKFNLPVDVNTLTPARFVLARNGSMINTPVTITPMDSESKLFKVSGLEALMTEDGDYGLTIDLPNVATIDGEKGLMQQTVEWKLDTTPPALLSFTGINEGGFDDQHFTGMQVTFSEAIHGFNMSAVELWKDGAQLPISQVHFDSLSGNVRELSQFRLLTYYPGNYVLKVNMNIIYDDAGITGTGIEEYNWIVDREPPSPVENLRIDPDLGYSATDGVTSVRKLTLIMTVPDQNVDISVYKNDFGKLILLSDTSNVSAGELRVPAHLSVAGNAVLEVHCTDKNGNSAVTKLPVFIDESALSAEFRGVPAKPVTAHPESIILIFSERIVSSSLDISKLQFRKNGIPADKNNLVIQQVSDTAISVSGFSTPGSDPGEYTLGIDLSGVEKYRSGLRGSYTASTKWTVYRTNSSPVADAGEDFTIIPGEQYQLDASGSDDPDYDVLSYEWFAPEGILLDDPYSVSPSFVVPAEVDTTEYVFLLSVSDGFLNATDKVYAYVLGTSDGNDPKQESKVMVYPNPARDYFTISVYNTEVMSVRLIDFTGRIIMHKNWSSEQEQTFRLEEIPPGVYLVLIHTKEEVVTRKIIVGGR